MASKVHDEHAEVKKSSASATERRKVLYSKEELMPAKIFDNLPYKETYEALKTKDIDKLKKLLCSFVASIATQVWNNMFDKLKDDKKEKKRLLKALVYLDALITLYRMPN